MSDIKANVICPWFDGDKFCHSIAGGANISAVSRKKTWSGNFTASYGNDNIILEFNSKESCSYVIDLGCIYSKESIKYPPPNRIVAFTEPSIWLNLDKEKVKRISKYYPKMILAWHKQLVCLPQGKFWNSTTKWVSDNVPCKKEFGISGFVSNKSRKDGDGYGLRYDIILNQHLIKTPSIIHNFTQSWKGKKIEYPLSSKDNAMGYMFHLAIENVSEKGYFTEKLIDCLASKVVPLYFGAPDIDKFFKLDGMILLDKKNWIQQLNSLSIRDFDKRCEAIEENYETSKKYWSFMDKLALTVYQVFQKPIPTS